MLKSSFYSHDACRVARKLLGKVIRVKHKRIWLSAQIIETEAYYLEDKASHASLGWTPKRAALFMPAGTIYMYYARGKPSLNVSCQGDGNAVLIKSAIVYLDDASPIMLRVMQQLNPINGRMREPDKLCSGQTLVCRSLGLTVADWDQKQFDREGFYLEDVGYKPKHIIQTTRLGIPEGRDRELEYRFIDEAFVRRCTKVPR